MTVPPVSRVFDPTKGAARLLAWFGLGVLMIGAPLVGVVSRDASFVALPIGAALLLAGFLLAVSGDGVKALQHAARQPIGTTAVFVAVWTGLSLIWTPFPGEAIPRYLATLVTISVAVVIIAHIPERRPRPTLFLLPGGLAITALATLAISFFGPDWFHGGSEFDPSLIERSVLTLVVLVWPALGALVAFNRWTWAMALAALIAGVVAAVFAQIAMAVFAIAALTFAVAMTHPRRAAMTVAILFGGLILLAPVLAFVLAPLSSSIASVGKSTVAAVADWRDLVSADNVRLLTGHGLDTARRGVVFGYLPPHTPRTLLFEVWYELGALGAIGLAALFSLGFLAAGEAASFIAPALLAGMVATLAIAVFGVATADNWYVTLVSLQAVAYGLLCRASRGGRVHANARETGDEAATLAPDPPPFR